MRSKPRGHDPWARWLAAVCPSGRSWAVHATLDGERTACGLVRGDGVRVIEGAYAPEPFRAFAESARCGNCNRVLRDRVRETRRKIARLGRNRRRAR